MFFVQPGCFASRNARISHSSHAAADGKVEGSEFRSSGFRFRVEGL